MKTAFIADDNSLRTQIGQLREVLQARGYRVIMGPPHQPPARTEFAPGSWAHDFGQTDVIVTSSRSAYPRALLEAAPRLRGVVFMTTGTESIDLDDADALSILVGNGQTPENFNSMAESTVMLMLNLMYDLKGTETVLRENLPRPKLIRARMLGKRTIGLVGLGRIARAVVERLQGWDVRLIAAVARPPSRPVPEGVALVSLDELLAQSDIVSVHASLTAGNQHMIGARELALMKPTAHLVNTARGGLVDEAALIEALKAGRLAGAALDTFEQEPLPASSELRQFGNVILTPHMVGHTRDGQEAVLGAALENIDRLMRGELPLYCRNPATLERWRERVAAITQRP